MCPGCGEKRMISYDPALRRWNCDVCGWSWIWRAIAQPKPTALRVKP